MFLAILIGGFFTWCFIVAVGTGHIQFVMIVHELSSGNSIWHYFLECEAVLMQIFSLLLLLPQSEEFILATYLDWCVKEGPVEFWHPQYLYTTRRRGLGLCGLCYYFNWGTQLCIYRHLLVHKVSHNMHKQVHLDIDAYC